VNLKHTVYSTSKKWCLCALYNNACSSSSVWAIFVFKHLSWAF